MIRKCFVISPIGQDKSVIREHVDDVFNYIIQPAMEAKQIDPIRADHINEPGKISKQMFEAILNYDVCVAILTDHNPNVFYELAIAQSAGRPIILLINKDQTIPFDVKDIRCISYDFRPGEIKKYVAELIQHLDYYEKNNWKSTYILEEYGYEVINLNKSPDFTKDKNDIFVSSPMTSVSSEEFLAFKELTVTVINILKESGQFNTVYYAGQDILNSDQVDPASISVKQDLEELRESKYYLLLYPKRLVSSVLVEAGYALALKKISTYFVQEVDDLPYMLREAAQSYLYVNTYRYKDKNDLVRLIKKYTNTIFSTKR